jgi:hypothetical protein
MYTFTPARKSRNARRTVRRKIRIETDQRTVVSLEFDGEYEMRNEPCQIRRASRTTKLRTAAARAKRRRTTLPWYRSGQRVRAPLV